MQQYLPFTVLKPRYMLIIIHNIQSCNSTYRLRYWNPSGIRSLMSPVNSCNSTYRLRYWNQYCNWCYWMEIQCSCNSTYRLRYWNLRENTPPWRVPSLPVATVLTVYGIETSFLIFLILRNLFLSCNSTYRLRYWNI